MRFIKGLQLDTLKLLERIYKQSKYDHVRRRAKCVKLSYEGYKINDLTKIFNVTRITILNWLNDWDDFCGKQTKPTVLVIDNASIHTSNKIIKKNGKKEN
jgi:hypothetical protein